ncbi:hypothetical protein K4L44_12205 [Halosquirtibacter laminarini]|uniref:Uncharacterized protein n=1 Tax=Halosquirtibacter laminarini TaxID=3374600 RepID=A0AC61NCU0_9BACT|nr:hypothetical protein K4L44_12205 [Prolixibacteraceae bacterium]
MNRKKSASKKSFISKLVGGEIFLELIRKKFLYIILVFALLLMRLTFSYRDERMLIKIDRMRDSIAIKSMISQELETELQQLGRPSEVYRKIKQQGLKLEQSRDVPGVIYIEKEEK